MVQVGIGNKLRFTVRFNHQGAAFSGAKIRCSIGQKLFDVVVFDEILWAESPSLSFPNDSTPRTYEQIVDVFITSAISPGSFYEAEVKLTGIPGGDLFWRGPTNDIEIIAGGAQAVFSDLRVGYSRV